MPPLHHRDGGAVAACLDSDAYGEIICDGFHIAPHMVRLSYRLLGHERLVLVSDSMEGTACPDGNYTIAVYNPSTGENRRVIELPGNWESPEWAADNRQVVCKRTSGRDSALYVIDTKTGKQRLLLKTNSRLYDPAWSPCTVRQ